MIIKYKVLSHSVHYRDFIEINYLGFAFMLH